VTQAQDPAFTNNFLPMTLTNAPIEVDSADNKCELLTAAKEQLNQQQRIEKFEGSLQSQGMQSNACPPVGGATVTDILFAAGQQ
jgi:hypothetical protein